jgi:twitching motility protein PilT
MDFSAVLESMVKAGASDLHLKAGSPPILRVDGALQVMDMPTMTKDPLIAVADQILTPRQKKTLEETRELDIGFSVPGLSRFRCNCYWQRGTVAFSLRRVSSEIPDFETLHLPPIVEELAHKQRGLILLTGTTGSGKSTTLAAMINSVNKKERRNIITIEDPIEYLFPDIKSVISQREIGTDCKSFPEGLRRILRQDPDTIMIGEVRDSETMGIAMMAADTGHLVMSTLHTVDAAQTLERIISFFPPHQQKEVRFNLANTLQAVVSLRLVPTADGKGRVPATEVMIATATVKECITEAERISQIRDAIQEGVNQYGMQSFDQSLMAYYQQGVITLEEAFKNCTNRTKFELKIKGIEGASDNTWSHIAMSQEFETADKAK